MNIEFRNILGKAIEITDEGIIFRDKEKNICFPYGSIDSIKMGFSGNVDIRGGGISVSIAIIDKYDKPKFKGMIPQILEKNKKAPSSKPYEIEATERILEKSVDGIRNYFGIRDVKEESHIFNWIPGTVDSMEDDEQLLYGFRGSVLAINGGRESVTGFIAIISNRRFYYAGQDGRSSVFVNVAKGGSIDLKDVHAVSSGTEFLQPAWVKFETKNEDYKISTFEDVEVLKSKLNEAIKLAKVETKAGATVIQQVSAMDELKKLKELLDLGIVTQEEFDAKKKQLLGL